MLANRQTVLVPTFVFVHGHRRFTGFRTLGRSATLADVTTTEAAIVRKACPARQTFVGLDLEPAGHLLAGLAEHLNKLVGHLDVAIGVVERGRPTDVSHPARSADSVDVVLDRLGQVVVDDVAHVADVESAGGDGGGDEDGLVAALEVPERRLPLTLIPVAVDGGRGKLKNARRR